MKKLLVFIFLLGLVVRFLYFPGNIYFGYDQARDAYESIKIYKELDFKIIGPSAAAEDLFHGPLYWYLIGPIYVLFGGNPVFPAALLLTINALGVFLIYLLGQKLFNRSVGLIAAFLFASSYEQTQYAMYFGNPAPAVLTVMLFYLGLSLWFFKRDWRGLPLALLGLGLSVQFEFFLVYLGVVFLGSTILFRPKFNIFNKNKLIVSGLAFVLPLSTFILAELRFNFRTTSVLLEMLSGTGGGFSVKAISVYLSRLLLLAQHNIWGVGPYKLQLYAALLFFVVAMSSHKKLKLLLIWLFSSSLLILFGEPNLYYINIGISPAVILIASFFVYKIFKFSNKFGIVVLTLIIFSNLSQIKNNSKGIINDIYVQEGMFLSQELDILDYIYLETGGKDITIGASTMPLNINTTWAYLFNWYGVEKYGYLPYWSTPAADGYPGELPKWTSQSDNYVAFSIIEPRRGVRDAFIENFLLEEEQYGQVVEEREFGEGYYTQFIVQRRSRY